MFGHKKDRSVGLGGHKKDRSVALGGGKKDRSVGLKDDHSVGLFGNTKEHLGLFGNKQRKQRQEERRHQEISASLLEACSAETPSLEKIQTLVGKYRDSVKAKDANGEGPLHLVCFNGASLDVVAFLHNSWPYGLRSQSNRKWIPLHSACFGSASLEVIQYMVKYWENSVQSRDNHERLPLHLACFRGAPLHITQYLVEHFPDSLKCKDSGGSLVLHLACDNKAPLATIQWLVQQWPESVRQTNNYGSLPLHRACFSGASPEVIQFLVRGYPQACRETTNDGDLPLHLACGAGAPLSVIKTLLREWPESIHAVNSFGKTPLDTAEQAFASNKPSSQVIQFLKEKEHPPKQQPRRKSEPPPAPKTSPKKAPSRTKSTSAIKKAKQPTILYAKERSRIRDVISGERDRPVSVPKKYVEAVLLPGQKRELPSKGYFGVVWKGYDPVIQQEFTVKRVNRDLLMGATKEEVEQVKHNFRREQEALLQYKHPNIALLYAYAISDHRSGQYLLYKPAEKGSLAVFWQSELGCERLASFPQRAQIALNVLVGLRFLHLGNSQIKPSFHRDIKSANIVLQKDMTAQLIDVGLATFRSDPSSSSSASSTGVKGTRGYVCPKYCTGAISFEASGDIFSFGVVLAELWSGRLQNHRTSDGRTYNFYEEYIDEEERFMEDDLDKSLGFGVTDELPKYMRDFEDLALSCMARKPNKRPSSEDVMNRLEKVWQASKQASFLDEMTEDSTRVDDDEGLLNESLHLISSFDEDESAEEYICRFCRTYANEAGCDECPMCVALQRERVRIATAVSDKLLARPPRKKSLHVSRSKNRSLQNDKQQTTVPLMTYVSDPRLNNQIPRLFVLVPADQKSGWSHPKAWLRSHWASEYHLFFVCGHTFQVTRPPIKLVVSKAWVEKIAPVLVVSLTVLLVTKINMELGNVVAAMTNPASDKPKETANQAALELSVEHLSELLDEAKEMLDERDKRDNSSLLDRIRAGKELSDANFETLNGEAYELVVEKAREDRWWRSAIDPVRKRGEDSILWVSKAAAFFDENEYEIVPT